MEMTRAFVKEKEKERLLCLWVELSLEEKSFCWFNYSRKKHNAGTSLLSGMYMYMNVWAETAADVNNNSVCWIIMYEYGNTDWNHDN